MCQVYSPIEVSALSRKGPPSSSEAARRKEAKN